MSRTAKGVRDGSLSRFLCCSSVANASWMRRKAKLGRKGRRKLSEAALPKRAENWVLSFQILRSWARTTGKMTGRGLELP